MWRVFNKLFGWDYLLFSYADEWEVRRLHTFPDGTQYVKYLGEIMLVSDFCCSRIITK